MLASFARPLYAKRSFCGKKYTDEYTANLIFNLITSAFEGIQTSYLVHVCLLAMAIMVLLVAMETLLPWQWRHVFITLLFEGL